MNLYDKILKAKPFFIIAGPCVIESEAIMMEIAEKLKKICEEHKILFIFKSSFLKANRTSINSYSGPGLDSGLRILEKIKKEFDLPILTDIHESDEAKPVSEVADIIQIPAFLARQTLLIRAAAQTGKIVNIKKGQFMAPEDMKAGVEKITAENNHQVLVTERGSFFGYHDLVVDFRSFPIMNELGYPVIFDVTHSLQMPSIRRVSGGKPEMAPMLAKAALATGYVNGIFFETHPEPSAALSDGMSMINLDYT